MSLLIDVALAIPVVDGRMLVARRADGQHLAGFWEFPGGKLNPEEEPADGARRELAEETGLSAGELEPLAVVVHEYPDRALRFHVYLARDPGGEVRIDHDRESAWMTLAELERLEMPEANVPILRALRWRVPE